MAWAPDYVTLIQAKEHIRLEVLDTLDDLEIRRAITSASRAVDNHTRRQFGVVAAPEVRYYTAHWSITRERWVVDVDDLMTAVGLAVAVDITSDGTYSGVIAASRLTPPNAIARARPWTAVDIPSSSVVQPDCQEWGVRVTATWGWSAVPATVETATLIQTLRFLSRRDSPYGIAGSPSDGSEMRLQRRLDPDVEVSLRGYVRNRIAERVR